jgi:two-component system, OmpR family, response regulator MtrA
MCQSGRAMIDPRPLVLIVDDNASSATVLGQLLREDGFDTEIEVGGSAALARLECSPIPDALITDFHLPDADGLVVSRRARASRAGIPIFVVTGDPDAAQEAVTDARLAAPFALITKPIDYAKLVQRLQAVVPGRGSRT